MVRRNIKRRYSGKTIILVSSIIILNLMGISYAYWESGISLTAKVFTGSLDIIFTEPDTHGQNYTVFLNDNKNVMVINGEFYERLREVVVETEEAITKSAEYLNYEGSLNLFLVNNGSVPVKLVQQRVTDDNNILNLDSCPPPDILLPGMNGSWGPIMINAGQGEYKFEIELNYSNE